MSGVFTNRPALAQKLMDAGRESGERVWKFPFDADFDSRSREQDRRRHAMHHGRQGRTTSSPRASSAASCPRTSPGRTWICPSATRTGGLGHINTEITGFGVRYALELMLEPAASLQALESRQ